jgi:1,4-dihydroxy-2-naphthoate octaprenyltransferase
MLALSLASLPLILAFSDLEPWLLLPLACAPVALPLRRTLAAHRDGPSLNKLLADTGRLLAVFSLLLSAGLLLSS